MAMEAGLDTGPVLLREALPIGPRRDRRATCTTGWRRSGRGWSWRRWRGLDALVPEPQPEAGVTYAAKIDKAEARIDWTRPAVEVDRLIRGPVAVSGRLVRDRGRAGEAPAGRAWPRASGAPGEVLDDRLTVACGEGALRLVRLQRAGRAAMEAGEFLRGWPLGAGTRLG